MNKTHFAGNDSICVTTQISNNGQYDGEEVVQCYVSSPEWEKEGLKEKLVDFKRIFIKKGETKSVNFNISKNDLLRWDSNNKGWRTAANKYKVSVVAHSAMDNSSTFSYNKK